VHTKEITMGGTIHDESAATSGTDWRRYLETGGLLAGAAVLFGGAPTADAASRIGSELSTRKNTMPTWKPDPTFYPSPRSAMQAPAETSIPPAMAGRMPSRWSTSTRLRIPTASSSVKSK
jgi:hypothetical protein